MSWGIDNERTDESRVTSSGAASTVRTTHSVLFYECNPELSATCDLLVNTAPK